jgi:hypothetical protein
MVIYRIFSWCLIMSSMFKNGPPQLVMFMTLCIAKCSPLQFVTCNLNPQKIYVSCGQNSIKWCSSLVLQTPISKGSWQIVHMPIIMMFISRIIWRCLCENGWQGMNLLVPLGSITWWKHKIINCIEVTRTTKGHVFQI